MTSEKKNFGKKFLSDLKLYSDYFKWNEKLNRYENWNEACSDIVDGHKKKYANVDLSRELDLVLELMKSKTILASQRNLQFRHDQIMRHNMRMYNCVTLHFVNPRNFGDVLYLGLCGCGVGSSLLLPFINQLPELQKREKGTKTYIIPDSIEGWKNAIDVLMSSYFTERQVFPEYSGYNIRFDYSQIREAGSFINGGFKAPGPNGLKNSLESIEKLLDHWILTQGPRLRPIAVFDILCHSSDAVLSGGVRRSALSMIVDPNDKEMMLAKTGNWRTENPQRGRSNNSVLIHRQYCDENEISQRKFFDEIVGINDGANDLGFVFCNTWFDVFNPCFTIDTKVLTTNGWMTFGEMMEKQDTEDIYIVQDKRVKGKAEGIHESWDTDLSNTGVEYNKIGKVAKTGENVDIYELVLSCGRKVKATGNHKFSTKQGMKELLSLQIGDDVLVTYDQNITTKKDEDFYDGFLSGMYVCDGYITEDNAGISVWEDLDDENEDLELTKSSIEQIFKESMSRRIESKELYSDGKKPISADIKFKLQTQVGNSAKYTLASTGFKKYLDILGVRKDNLSWLYKKSKNFKAGFVAGMFFTDGYVDYTESSESISLRITQSNKEFLNDLALILQEIGFLASVHDLLPEETRKLPNSQRVLQDYNCKASYRLCIDGYQQSWRFIEDIEFLHKSKINKANDILKNLKGYKDILRHKKVVSINYLGKEDVYCLEENNNRTLIANGITAARCFEIGFTPVDTHDKLQDISYEQVEEWVRQNIHLFGIQGCNLNEINAEKCVPENGKTLEESFLRACEGAAILGTLQAGYTDFPFLSPRTEKLVRREALLGVSITGWMNNPALFNEELLRKGAAVVVETNKKVAAKIDINQAARTTCVKPSGNASVVLMTESGIHPAHSLMYFRVMQLNKNSDTAKFLEQEMPFLLEESVWSKNNTDHVVFVPIINPPDGLFKKDMKGVKHLELIKLVQNNWIVPGTNRDIGICNLTNHNCSCTVIIDDSKAVADYIWNNRKDFTAVSFISDYGDKDFNQAPFTSVMNFEEIASVYGEGSMFASGLIVDGLHYFNNNLWNACDCLLDKNIPVTGTREQVLLKKDWLRRAKQFAKNYFKNDIKKMIYCLKDIHLFHKWKSINRQMKEISLETVLNKPSYKDVSDYAAVACSGGSCEVTRLN
jgi:intein/homing endonuclease